MDDMILRIADGVLALFWAFVLLRTLSTGHIGFRDRQERTRRSRPLAYWFMVFIFALMVVHFGGLALVGQSR